MAIPHSLKIGGYTYEVIVEKRKANHGDCNFGTASTPELKIWIEADCATEQQEETLIHEILEVIGLNHDLNISHQTISTIADNLYQVLKDNDIDMRKEN